MHARILFKVRCKVTKIKYASEPKDHSLVKKLQKIELDFQRKKISEEMKDFLQMQARAEHTAKMRLAMMGQFHKGLAKVNAQGTGVAEVDQEIKKEVGEWNW